MPLPLIAIAAAALPAVLQAGADMLRQSGSTAAGLKMAGTCLKENSDTINKAVDDQVHYHENDGWEKDD